MDWMLPVRTVFGQSPPRPGLSRRVLRHLLCSRRVGIGSRVLDAGCGGGHLTQFLHQLAIDAAGVDASEIAIEQARRAAPHLQFACVPDGEKLPFAEQEFDLVVARSLISHQADLLGAAALHVTANLLSVVRPGGELVLVARFEPQWADQPGGHLRSCFARHFAPFPGQCKVSYIADSLLTPAAWKWVVGRQPRWGYVAAALRIPERPIPHAQWHAWAAQGRAMGGDNACCAWAAVNGEACQPRHKAA